MDTDTEPRLLLSFLGHLKTNPAVVTCLSFSQACAVILCFMSFILTNLCLLRFVCDMSYDNKSFNTLMNNVDQVLQSRINNRMLSLNNSSEATTEEVTLNGEEMNGKTDEDCNENTDLIEA